MPTRPPGPPPPLPVEVYQDIFQRAIGSSKCEYDEDQFWQDTYTPFRDCQTIPNKSNAPARCNLLLVCRLWHSFAQRLAYETIFVGKHAPSLLTALSQSAKKNNGAGYGQFVRKIVFCARDKKGVNKTTLTRLLAACPHVTTIVREAQDFSAFPITLPSFPSLHRLDWWGYNQPSRRMFDEYLKTYTKPTNTTPNDLYLFRDILAASPNLKYLSIGVQRCSQPRSGEHRVAWNHEDSLVVPVTTFRLEGTVPWITRDIGRWSFPNLENLIINSQETVNTRSCRCGECLGPGSFPLNILSDRIRKLEFTDTSEDLGAMLYFPPSFWATTTSTILSACKNVTELAFDFPADILRHITLTPSIELLRLHTLRLRMGRMEERRLVEWATEQWEGITVKRLPALRRVILVEGGGSLRRPPDPRSSLYQFFVDLSKRLGPAVMFLDEDGQTCSFDQSLPDVVYSVALPEGFEQWGIPMDSFPNAASTSA